MKPFICRKAIAAEAMSLKTMNACPRILKAFEATISKIGPNCEKRA
jgi:hypothetical protein